MSDLTTCPVCGSNVKVEGHTTKRYVPVSDAVEFAKWLHEFLFSSTSEAFLLGQERFEELYKIFLKEKSK